MRPPPALRMERNAARQQRNIPVRLVASVCSQASRVVWMNGTLLSTAAAQTSAVAPPSSSAMAKTRSTSSARLRSPGAAVAIPPDSRIASASWVNAWAPRAARTTCAPAWAIASAVARPIPRLAPVTTATRSRNHGGWSGMWCRRPSAHLLIKMFVGVEAAVETQVRLGVPSTGRPPDRLDAHYGPGRAIDVTGRHQKAGFAVAHNPLQGAPAEGDDRSSGRLRLRGNQPERLIPSRRAEHRSGSAHDAPQDLARHT